MKTKTKILKLEWRVDTKGDWVADANCGMYRITFEKNTTMGGGDGYRVRFAGYPIALAETVQGAKDAASIHLNR